MGVAESLLAVDHLDVVGSSLEWGVVGLNLGDVVVGSSLTGAFFFSWDLSDDRVSLFLEFLAVEGLGVNSGAVVSHGSHGLSWGILDTWLGNIEDLGDWVRSDGLDINILLSVDEDSAWHVVGGGGWVVDGLSACNLLVDGLLSGDLNWNLNGNLFDDSVLFLRDGGDWNLDGLLSLFDGGNWNLDGLFSLFSGGDWNLDGSGGLLGDDFYSLDSLGDLRGDGLWYLDGVVLNSGGWDSLGDGGWDLLGDNLVSVSALSIAPVVPISAGVRAAGVDEDILKFVAGLSDNLGSSNFTGLDNVNEDGLLNVGEDFSVDEDFGISVAEDDLVNEVGNLNIFEDDLANKVGNLNIFFDDLVNEGGH